MADMFDCGRSVYEAWKRGAEHITRWLGPYNRDMPMTEIHRRLEHDKLMPSATAAFERGFVAAKGSSND